MEPNQLDIVIKSLGFDPVQVGQWTTLLVAWRLVIKLISGKVQAGLESAIQKAKDSGDGRIIGWLAGIIQSLPYRVFAWLVDSIFSVKLPLKVE